MPVRTASLKSIPALVCAAVLLSTAVVAFAAGPKAYVGNFKDSTVSIIDTANGAVIGTVPVSAGPHGMTMTPDGTTVYVSGDESSTVSVIDTATDRVTYAVDVGKTPHGLAMQPDGRILLVAIYGEDRVAFVDTATRAIMASVDVPKPHTIAIRPDGKLAYVASQQPGNFALVVVDLARRTVVRSIALDKPPRDLEFSYDGKALYFTLAGVSAVQVLDPQTDRIVAAVATGASPHIASYFRGAPAATAVVQGPGELLLFDPATNAPVRSIAVGKQPHWVAASADGKRAYVTNEGSNDVSVVDLTSGQVTTIAVGNAPRKVVVQQSAMKAGGAATISIANFAFAPGELTIAAGDTVTWSNDDGAPHGLAYKDGAPGTNLLLPGAKFARTFDRAGSYDYICSVHPYMSGKVIVRAP